MMLSDAKVLTVSELSEYLRVHRSTIVNLEFVREMEPLYSGDYKITMRDGTELASSRAYRAQLRPLLRQAL